MSKNNSTSNQYNPGVLDILGRGVLEAMKWFHKNTRECFEDYCPLDGVLNEYTFFTDTGMLVTVYDILGSSRFIGEPEKKEFFLQLKDHFKNILRESSTAIQLVYVKDKKSSEEYLNQKFLPLISKARSLDLDLDIIFKERIKRMLPFMSGTNAYLAVCTNPVEIMSPEALKEFRAERDAELKAIDFPLKLPAGMQYYLEPGSVLSKHKTICESIERLFKDIKIELKCYNVHEAMSLYRQMLFPNETSLDWRARLPVQYKDDDGNPIPPDPITYRRFEEEPFTQGGLDGLTAMLYPSLGRQLAASAIEKSTAIDPVVKIGSRYCGTQLLDMLPASPKSFDLLIEALERKEIPFRASFTFYGGADKYTDTVSMRKSYSVMAKIFGGKNKYVADAADGLLDFVAQGGSLCGVSVQVATWHNEKRSCDENLRQIGKILDGWGTAQSVPEVGDPILGFTAGLPGWHDNLRHILVHGYDYLLNSLPLNIIKSPWDDGIMFFVNNEGGLFPYSPISSKQQTWNVLCFAPPGGGKSVMISAIILAAILDPTIEGLPKVAMLDIGNSMKGLIELLRAASLKNKERFQHIEFELSDRFGINIFDTRLGCPQPTSVERGFIINFLCLTMTPLGEENPIDSAVDIATKLVDEAYRLTSDDEQKTYESGKSPRVHQYLLDKNFKFVPNKTTWWQVVYFAMDNGDYEIAGDAQRFAVPTLNDLPGILTRSPTIKASYDENESGRNILINAKRLLIAFTDQYSSLTKPSSFNFQGTDVCVIDLNKVTMDTGVEGKRKNAIAYMVSRYLLGKDFLLNEDILQEMSPRGQSYYRGIIENVSVVRKYLIYDEFHRTGGVKNVRKTVEDDMRNGRKFNLFVMLASQDFNDFDENVIKISTTRFVMRVDSPEEADVLVKKYEWSQSIRHALSSKVKGNEGSYSSFLLNAALKGRDPTTQVLRSFIGSTELAAYATTREDAALRSALLAEGLPYWDCVRIIGQLYKGQVQSIVEKQMIERRTRSANSKISEDEELKGALTPLINQVRDVYLNEQKG